MQTDTHTDRQTHTQIKKKNDNDMAMIMISSVVSRLMWVFSSCFKVKAAGRSSKSLTVPDLSKTKDGNSQKESKLVSKKQKKRHPYTKIKLRSLAADFRKNCNLVSKR